MVEKSPWTQNTCDDKSNVEIGELGPSLDSFQYRDKKSNDKLEIRSLKY